MEYNLWVLKSVLAEHRALKTVDSYNDNPESFYNYDSKVANHKQIKANDYAIIIDKEKILGFARILTITKKKGQKILKKCKTCGSTTIDTRTKLKPKYRCNKGHESNSLLEKEIEVTKYSANFGNTFIPVSKRIDQLSILRPFYTNNYNQNMSMQLLDIDAFDSFPKVKNILLKDRSFYLDPASADEMEGDSKVYTPLETDDRENVIRQIKARRGQKKFRDKLRVCYNGKCAITGCAVLDILEAAHINPYRGENDNHVSNGLLLRADIHTLFDLNLIGINPTSLKITISKNLKNSEYDFLKEKPLLIGKNKPSALALNIKWKDFLRINN